MIEDAHDNEGQDDTAADRYGHHRVHGQAQPIGRTVHHNAHIGLSRGVCSIRRRASTIRKSGDRSQVKRAVRALTALSRSCGS